MGGFICNYPIIWLQVRLRRYGQYLQANENEDHQLLVIGYLVAGFPGATVAALATFLPCYLFTILPAPYFHKYGKHPSIKAFVDGITAAVVGALAGAVIVIAFRTIKDIPTTLIALATITVLLRYRIIKEPYIILVAAVFGLVLKYFTSMDLGLKYVPSFLFAALKF